MYTAKKTSWFLHNHNHDQGTPLQSHLTMLITHLRDLMHVKHLHHTSFFFWVKFCHKATLEKIKINLLQILFFGKIFAKFSAFFFGGDCQHNSVYCLLFEWCSTEAWPKSVANYGEIYLAMCTTVATLKK